MNLQAAKKKKMINILFIVISILLICLGFYHIYEQNRYIKDGAKVIAVVENVLVHPTQQEGQTLEEYKKELEHYNMLLDDYRRLGLIKESTTFAIIITFEFDNKEYTTELGYYSNEIKIGSTVTIYLNKDNPLDVIYDGANNFGLYFCMIVGTVMLVGSLIFFFIDNYNNKCNILLKDKGKLIQAEIIYADIEENKSSFNKHPYIFTCVYFDEDKQEQVYFTSESIYCKNRGDSYIGKKVDVFVDANDYNNYLIDSKLFEK
jgi:hypothetical protein